MSYTWLCNLLYIILFYLLLCFVLHVLSKRENRTLKESEFDDTLCWAYTLFNRTTFRTLFISISISRIWCKYSCLDSIMFGRLFDVPIRLEKRKNVHMVWLLRAMPVGKLYEVYHKYHMREYVAGWGGGGGWLWPPAPDSGSNDGWSLCFIT